MTHEVDSMGFPIDPFLQSLEIKLSDLAALWRGHRGDPVRQEEITQEYLATLAHLYELGWDGYLDLDSELPYKLMPEKYVKKTIDGGNT